MTNYDPAQGPLGPAPGSPPPGYRQPPGHRQPRGPGFDPKSVDPLDWAAMGAGLLALIFSFFAYYSYSATSVEQSTECAHPSASALQVRGLLSDLCGGTTAGAWHGFFGWFGVLLGLIAAGLVAVSALLPQVKPPAWTRLVALGAAGLGLLSTLLALAVVPDWPAIAQYSAFYTSRQYSADVSNGHGFSYWLVLILLIVLTVAAFVRFRQTGGSLPAFLGGRRPAGQPGYGPPVGYGASQGGQLGYPPASEIPPGSGQPPAYPPAPQQQQPSAPWAPAMEPPPAPVFPPQPPPQGRWPQTPPQNSSQATPPNEWNRPQ